MRDIQHHGTSIRHDFEDHFLQEENAQDKSFQFFKFISPTISTWVQHVLQGKLNFIPTHTLEDLLHGSKPMNFESMVYVHGWIMEEHKPIDIDYQPIRNNDYIKDLITQHYMEFNEDR